MQYLDTWIQNKIKFTFYFTHYRGHYCAEQFFAVVAFFLRVLFGVINKSNYQHKNNSKIAFPNKLSFGVEYQSIN